MSILDIKGTWKRIFASIYFCHFISLGSKTTVDGDCSPAIKRCLLLVRKAMTNLDSILKSRHYFANKGLCSQSYGFSNSHYGCWSRTIKIAGHWSVDAFELWFWRRLLRVPWTARRSNQWILRDISPEYSLEGLIWSSNTLATWCEELTHVKRLCSWEKLKTGREGDDRGWDGWMASPTWWTWVWVNSGSW